MASMTMANVIMIVNCNHTVITIINYNQNFYSIGHWSHVGKFDFGIFNFELKFETGNFHYCSYLFPNLGTTIVQSILLLHKWHIEPILFTCKVDGLKELSQQSKDWFGMNITWQPCLTWGNQQNALVNCLWQHHFTTVTYSSIKIHYDKRLQIHSTN